jgi:hypothetical protein
MKYLLPLLIILFSTVESTIIFDFNKTSDTQNWIIVDDVVMGGRSSGSFSVSPDGYGVFEGTISLKNNGGFSSVRYRSERILTEDKTKLVVRLLGDGKEYQLRVSANPRNDLSYTAPFETSGEWQEIEIPLKDMYPVFRGRKLNRPNFDKEYFQEITFLIGNGKRETFKLLIDDIRLE